MVTVTAQVPPDIEQAMSSLRRHVAILVTVLLAGCGALDESRRYSQYLGRGGEYRFTVPEGWTEIPPEELTEGGFASGYRRTPGVSHPYFLVKLDTRRISPPQYRAEVQRALHLHGFSDLPGKKHRTWMYLPRYDVFLGLYRYHGPEVIDVVSVSARKCFSEGAIVFHFYWKGDEQMMAGLGDLEMVVSSLSFSERDSAAPRSP